MILGMRYDLQTNEEQLFSHNPAIPAFLTDLVISLQAVWMEFNNKTRSLSFVRIMTNRLKVFESVSFLILSGCSTKFDMFNYLFDCSVRR